MSNSSTSTTYSYTVLLGPPDATQINIETINDSGVIAGNVTVGNVSEGFIDDNGNYTLLRGPQGSSSLSFTHINDSGDAVGVYKINNNTYGFTYENGIFTTIAPPNGATTGGEAFLEATQINNSGEISGYYSSGTTNYEFIDVGGTLTTITAPSGGSFTGGGSLNDNGQIVGGYLSNGNVYSYLYSKGTFITLSGPAGSSNFSVSQINDSGTIAGDYDLGGISYAYTYSNGVYTQISFPPGTFYDYIAGINASGELVGLCYPGGGGGAELPFVYENGVSTVLYGSQSVPLESDSLGPDVAINNSGQVVGNFYGLVGINYGHYGFVATPVCYLRGTRLLTPHGYVPIETLSIGDALVTRLHGTRAIKWIGRQSFDGRFIARNRDKMPVRIKAGALAENLPARDLFVSPAHSMLLGENLVLAKNLVNGITITQDYLPDVVEYFQVEFETHDCVLAEGCWSESYADLGDLRAQFHNAAEFRALYPAHTAPEEPALCAPRPEGGLALSAALRPVVARATKNLRRGKLRGVIDQVTENGEITGWAQDEDHPDMPVLLDILLCNRVITRSLACDFRHDLHQARIGRGRCAFTVKLPGNFGPATLATARVRRTADQCELPMSDAGIFRLAA